MKLRPPYHLPADKQALVGRAEKLEWLTLFFLATIIIVMYFAMGSSQAMKTAWIEDMLSFIPPVVFLVSMRFRKRDPDEKHPDGYRSAVLLAFLAATVAILILGLYMLYDSAAALLGQRHPTIGHFTLFGHYWPVWSGWVMIAALVYSMVPVVILGRLKTRVAEALHEPTLYADAAMNKADWMTAAAAIAGILGIGFGLWWADAVAAAIISLDVTRDGVRNMKNALSALIGQRPMKLDGSAPLDVGARIITALQKAADVEDVDVRLVEEGHVFSGEIFVVLRGERDVAERLAELQRLAKDVDWRIYDLNVMPVKSLHK